MQPGFNKLTWTKHQAAEDYVLSCKRHINELQLVIDRYQSSIIQCCRFTKKISENLLVKIDTKKIFENLEFEYDQEKHRKQVSANLTELYDSIESTLKLTYEIFRKDESEAVQSQWRKLIDRMYDMLEKAFRLNVNNSLLELSRAINGDGKSIPNPLIKVKVLLESYEEKVGPNFGMNDMKVYAITKYKLNFCPTLDQLAHLINSIGQYLLTDCIEGIIKSKYDVFPKNKPPIYLNISRDEEKLKIEQQIALGIESNAKLLEEYLTQWNNSRELWEVNRSMFLQRYEQRNPTVATFDSDIAR
jgi:dynein heavy chain, axonemal